MSAILDTKKRILDSLRVKPKTLTDLTNELELSMPTVKQHLDELLGAGAISEGEGHGKWKYYNFNPNFDIDNYIVRR